MKFFIKDFLSKCEKIRSFLRIWSHSLNKSLMETSFFVQWYLRIILLGNYVMEENLFVYVECSVVRHATSRFSVRKNETKKNKKERKRVTPGWTDISGPVHVSFLSRSCMYYIMLILHNPINPLNVVSRNSFSWASNFTSPTTWCTNDWDGYNLPE